MLSEVAALEAQRPIFIVAGNSAAMFAVVGLIKDFEPHQVSWEVFAPSLWIFLSGLTAGLVASVPYASRRRWQAEMLRAADIQKLEAAAGRVPDFKDVVGFSRLEQRHRFYTNALAFVAIIALLVGIILPLAKLSAGGWPFT